MNQYRCNYLQQFRADAFDIYIPSINVPLILVIKNLEYERQARLPHPVNEEFGAFIFLRKRMQHINSLLLNRKLIMRNSGLKKIRIHSFLRGFAHLARLNRNLLIPVIHFSACLLQIAV